MPGAVAQWTGRFNAFDVLGIAKTEIRHSNVLAWLMDPAENHGLGDGVIRGFVNHTARNLEADDIFDDLLMDCDDFSIRREWLHIDILAVNEKEKHVLCIENKTFSGEHDNQLERYHTDVEREFPDCRRRFVFLTPDSREASEQEFDWLPMGYEDVLGIIEGAMAASTPAAEQREFILEYMDAVRRNFLEDRELKEICNRIYAKHRKALDLIYEYRPDTVSKVSDCCREWVRRKAESDETIQLNAGDKLNTTFTTGLMDRLVPRGGNPSGVFGKDGHYVYQIHVDDGGDVPRVRIQLVFNFEGLDEGPREECARVLTAIGETSSRNSGPLLKRRVKGLGATLGERDTRQCLSIPMRIGMNPWERSSTACTDNSRISRANFPKTHGSGESCPPNRPFRGKGMEPADDADASADARRPRHPHGPVSISSTISCADRGPSPWRAASAHR